MIQVVSILRGMPILTALALCSCSTQAPEDIELAELQGQMIQPHLYFPKHSHVCGVEVHQVKGRWDIVYDVVSPLSWEDTYSYYKQRYRDAEVKWNGRQDPSNGKPFYVVSVFTNTQRRVVSIGISIKQQADQADVPRLGLSKDERSSPLITALLEVSDPSNKIGREGNFLALPMPRTNMSPRVKN
jgi:hypothetical protein